MNHPEIKCVIMGGGRGTRLHPLTSYRCKPAVPLGGSYRLVDIPISNCLNSGFNQIYVLTQFKTTSLHKHIQQAYRFDRFDRGFVDILAAEQTLEKESWYQGTADAVRQNLGHLHLAPSDLVIILSGDQLYRMDLAEMVARHRQTSADLTIATKVLPARDVSALGVTRVDENGAITGFVEKPTDPAVIESLHVHGRILEAIRATKPACATAGNTPVCLASMGIYVFRADVLIEALDNTMTDFGKEVIPALLGKRQLQAHVFDGYWEDIGTVGSFWEANLALTETVPPFNFFDSAHPIYTHARFLPPAKINNATVERVVLSEGSIVSDATLLRCVIGIRSVIRGGSRLTNVVMLGADVHEEPEDIRKNRELGRPDIGIGKNCVIQNAIIDKNSRVGDNCRLSPEGVEEKWENESLYKRDGVLIVKKDAIVPDNTTIGTLTI
ncbi:MAG: glucose-1-phosphate adenylyltransferase [Puniceicoccales bacterium]|jgi:glucose-1-phosphate adenylyltransferase|nr:glucose-1-phosphate adenylyltransferase [Puniceicoccales bacterium]